MAFVSVASFPSRDNLAYHQVFLLFLAHKEIAQVIVERVGHVPYFKVQ